MPSPHTFQPQSQEPSSDWFSSDPVVYIQALDEFEQSLAHHDHRQQPDKEQEVELQEAQPPPAVHKRTHGEIMGDYLDSQAYGAATFGDFGEYMARKRAKLQVQNQTLASGPEPETNSKIFQGIAIYVRDNPAVREMVPNQKQVDGFTIPSVQELRKMVVAHGGEFHAYLDRKSLVYVSHPHSQHHLDPPQDSHHHLISHPSESCAVPADETRKTGMAG